MSLILMVGLAPQAGARTWFVEKDGSGDYTTIYLAMNAASSGDTIMIGPGRYDDFHPLVAPAWTTEAIVPVTKDNLTFIGSGNMSTIIGPTEMYLPGGTVEPKAIATVEDVEAKFVGLGVENADSGIYWPYGRVEIEGCRFENYRSGVNIYGTGGGVVKDSEFYSDFPIPRSIITQYPCGPLTISGCSFGGPDINEIGITINGTQNVQIDNCHSFARNSIVFENSSGTVTNCTTTEAVAQAVWVTSGAEVELVGNQLHGNFASIYVDSGSQVVGSGNIFSGGHDLGTIYVSTQSTVKLNNNHIFHDGELAVMLRWFLNSNVTQDMTNNYWGTTDIALIESWIYDINDDPNIHSVVDFQPIADGPVPTDNLSLDGLKAMFR